MQPAHRQLQVLGPTRVVVDGRPVVLRPRERDLLGALAIARARPVSVVALADVLWTVPPPSARKTIQNHVARVRAVLGMESIETSASTYRLGPSWETDLERFLQLCEQAERDLRVSDFEGQRARLSAALALLRGRPFESLEGSPALDGARSSIDQRIVQARESHVAALIETRRHQEAVRATEELVEARPDRETLWMLRALALLRDGDRRGAIEALQRCRRHVRETTGLSVGHAVQRLESLALADDPAALRMPVLLLIDSMQPIPGFATAGEQFFVGRTDELGAFDSVLSAVRRDRSSAVVLVQGVAGSGRSAFGRRASIMAAADGWLTARAACRPVTIRPLEPFGDLLVQVLRQCPEPPPRDTSVPTFMDRPDVLVSLQEPAVERMGAASLAEDVTQLFVSMSSTHPTVLVVDDADLLPPSSSRILAALRETSAQLVVMLLTSLREPAFESDVVIRLEPLSTQESRRLFSVLTGSEADDAIVDALHRSANGMPGPLRESILEGHAMASRTLPANLGGSPRTSKDAVSPSTAVVPSTDASPDRVISSALSRADPDVVDLCAAVALTAAPVDPALLSRVLAEDGRRKTTVLLSDAVARGLVRRGEDGEIWLASDSTADEAIARCTPARRQELHESWWMALHEAGAAVLSLVEHAVATAPLHPQRAIDALDAARAAAAANGMFLEAAEFEQRAIEIVRSLRVDRTEEFQRRISRCELSRQGGDLGYPSELWVLLGDAERSRDRVVAAQAAGMLCSLGPSTRFGVSDERIATVVERAVWHCPDAVVRSRAHAQASLFYSSTDFARSEAHFLAALADARLSGDDELIAYALGFACVSYLNPDHLAQRHDFANELVRLSERLGSELHRLEALHLLYGTQIQLGDSGIWITERALRTIDLATLGKPQRWMANYMRVGLLHLKGELDAAEQLNDQVLTSQPVDPSRAMANYAVQLFGIRVAQRRAGELAEMVHSVVADQPLARAWRGFAAFASACGGEAEAVRDACTATDNGLDLPRDIGWMGGVWLLARAASQVGLRAPCADLWRQLEPYSGQMTWVGICSYGPVDLALAELAFCLGDRGLASVHLERANAVVDRISARAFDADIEATRARLGG